MKNFVLETKNNSIYLICQPLKDMGLKHFFSSRIGGFSKEDYAELNLGIFTEDNKESIYMNINKALNDNNMNDNIVYLKQVHSDLICVVDNHNASTIKEKVGDALITREKNMPIGVFTADCVPCIVYDNKNKIIAVVHAGWKGTYQNILYKTINKIINDLGGDSNNIYVALGPSIGHCCFEVSADVAEKFRFVFNTDNRYFVDLFLENKKQAIDASIKEENIFISNICTKCNNNLFYSYRVNNKTGRIGTFVSL